MANLLKNVRVNFIAFLAGKACAAGMAILLPRLLGPDKMGIYTSAWGLAALVSVISDLGLATYLTREVSRARSQVSGLFYRALLVQVIQLGVAGAVLALAMAFGKEARLSPGLVALAFIGMALASLSSPFLAAMQGLEEFKVVGMVTTGASLLNATALGLALWLRPEPAFAFGAIAISGTLGFCLWAAVYLRLGLLDAAPTRWRLLDFFKGALPFAMVSTVNQIYVTVDMSILTWMLGPLSLGQYGAAVVVVNRMVPLLGALSGPLYPRLSAEFSAGALQRALRYLAALCLPLGVGGSLLAGPLMALLFGAAFADAGRAFRWLAWVPALIGLHGAMLMAMNALGKTKLIALIFLLNLGLNVGLNVAFIPRFGFEASAAISTLNEIVVVLASAFVLARAGHALGLRRWLWPAGPAALGMGLLLWLLPAPASFQTPLWVLLGASVYAALLWSLGFFGSEERMHIRRLLGREA